MFLLLAVTLARAEVCRQVEVEQVEVCQERKVEECGSCTTVYMRECAIKMTEAWIPKMVNQCTKSPQSVGCERGGRKLCRVDYRTTCSSRLEYQQVEEDFPECRREKVSSCQDKVDTEDDSERNNLVSPSSSNCRQVEVTRCQIQRRTVRKAKPVTRCQRLPTSLCAKRKCKQESTQCIRRVKMYREQRPEETCTLRPRRMCKGAGCRTVVRKLCRPSPPGTKEIQEICHDRLP